MHALTLCREATKPATLDLSNPRGPELPLEKPLEEEYLKGANSDKS